MSKLTLLVQEAAGPLRSATSEEILSAARSILARTVRRGASLESPRAVRDYLSVTLGNRPHEIFGVIYVDNRHRSIDWQPPLRATLAPPPLFPPPPPQHPPPRPPPPATPPPPPPRPAPQPHQP